MAWTPGQLLQEGKYRIEQRLGLGGFGITYLAKSQEYGKVVIKTLNDEVQQRPDFDTFQNDFFDEALKIRGCQHRHIVQVHRVFLEKVRHPNPGNTRSQYLRLACIAMEYIDGTDLDRLVTQKRRLPEADALRYIQQIGQALSVVHGQGLLHRDVKPNNIMVRRNMDEAVLIDFGIAREFTPNLTRTHTQFLTDGYAPIEQYEQQAKRGAFTDVYALAATLYSLVTGDIPINAQERLISLLRSHSDPLVPPQKKNPAVSDRVNAAIIKGMAIQPKDRPQTMTEWLQLLAPLSKPRAQPVMHMGKAPGSTKVAKKAASQRQPVGTDRRTLLKWLGFGSMGLWGAWMFRHRLQPTAKVSVPVQTVPSSDGENQDSGQRSLSLSGLPLQRITLDKEAVDVDDWGTIVKTYPVTVDTFVEDLGNGVTFTMVQIPTGTFMMGQTDAEKEELIRQAGDNYQYWYEDELPRHQVTISSFFMGMVTVTQALYEAVMQENPSYFEGSDRPVDRVSWHDAIAFCQKLSERTGKDYRLPSEAEWEYACRAGTITPFHFGATLTTQIANYRGDSTYGNGPKGEWRQQTTPVESFPPNAFGLQDMHGNVWEWCNDYWHNHYNGAPSDGSTWVGGGEGNFRLMRGGSWFLGSVSCRSASRLRSKTDHRSHYFSFRLACSSFRPT